MTNTTQPEAAKVQAPTTGFRGEIEQKWGRFSADEIAALKDNNDLVALVQAKYQLDKTKARLMTTPLQTVVSSSRATVEPLPPVIVAGGDCPTHSARRGNSWSVRDSSR